MVHILQCGLPRCLYNSIFPWMVDYQLKPPAYSNQSNINTLFLQTSYIYIFLNNLSSPLSLRREFCSLFKQLPNKCTYIVFNNLKFTLKHLKRSYMFQSYDHPQ